MKRVFTLLLTAALTGGPGLFGQARIVVTPSDNLIMAIDGASAGDTIVLTAGTHVARYTNMDIDKDLSIIAETTEKPLVYINQMDVFGENTNIYIEGIEFSGATVDSLTGEENLDNLEGDYFLNLHSDLVSCKDVTVQNCIIRNLNRSVLRGDRASYTVENFLFDNLIVHDLRGGGDYGPFRLKSRITFETFTLTNSTFYNILNKLIDNQDTPSYPMDFLIKNCTFYKWGGGKSAQYLFDIQTNDQANLVIQDCIFGKTNDDPVADPAITVNGWRMDENNASYLEMITTAMTPDFVLTLGNYAETAFDKDEYNQVDVDPDWANPESGDFTLPQNSPLLESSQTGGIIGDPRWDPDYGVGIRDLSQDPVFNAYPNPAGRVFYLEMDAKLAGNGITLYNTIGEAVLHFDKVGPDSPLNISGLKSGVYFIRIDGNMSQPCKLLVK